jgi:putative transposase
MVRYRRNLVPGGTFFFTVTLVDRNSSTLVDHIAALGAAFRTAQIERPFTIDAIVVLPEHLHTVMSLPPGDADFPGRWRRIKSLFSHRIATAGASVSPDARGEYAIWQRRFWEHTIRDDEDLERCVDYIHFNPVKHGLVARVRDWPHSSFHRYVRQGMLAEDWGGVIGDGQPDFGERE